MKKYVGSSPMERLALDILGPLPLYLLEASITSLCLITFPSGLRHLQCLTKRLLL
jgi:hypothetical protein